MPAGTPQPIIDKLAGWHGQINSTEDAKKTLLQFGMDPLDGDGAAMTAVLEARHRALGRVRQAREDPTTVRLDA